MTRKTDRASSQVETAQSSEEVEASGAERTASTPTGIGSVADADVVAGEIAGFDDVDGAGAAPMGDPGDLSSFGRTDGLPDLGGGPGPGMGMRDLGSSLLDDLGGVGTPDPTDGLDGTGDGWTMPAIDDQTGWAMDANDDILAGTTSAEYLAGAARMTDELYHESGAGSDVVAAFLAEAAAAATAAAIETSVEEAEAIPIPPMIVTADDDDDERESQGAPDDGDGHDGPRQDSTPVPDEIGYGGEGGDLDPAIGGDVDPAPDVEPAGGRGDLIAGGGDIDPEPELDDTGEGGGLDMILAGLGAIDPVEDGSTLLGGDEGDLAAMVDTADLGVDFDVADSLSDLEIGEDI